MRWWNEENGHMIGIDSWYVVTAMLTMGRHWRQWCPGTWTMHTSTFIQILSMHGLTNRQYSFFVAALICIYMFEQTPKPCFNQNVKAGFWSLYDTVAAMESVQFQPTENMDYSSIELTWENVYCQVTSRKDPSVTIDILRGVSGYARQSHITSIMGPSGAGKTTLVRFLWYFHSFLYFQKMFVRGQRMVVTSMSKRILSPKRQPLSRFPFIFYIISMVLFSWAVGLDDDLRDGDLLYVQRDVSW